MAFILPHPSWLRPPSWLSMVFLFFVALLLTGIAKGQEKKMENFVREGIGWHDKGEYKKALEFYQKALEIDPNYSLALYEMSLTYFTMKEYKKAQTYSQKVLDLKDGYILEATIQNANSLDLMGQTTEALQVYEKAMEDYDSYLLYYNHAVACLNAGKTDKAMESAIKAISDNPSHPSSHLVLSKAMEKKGSRVQAMLSLYFFLLLEPNSSRSRIEYERLLGLMEIGAAKTSERGIDVEVSTTGDLDFDALDLMVSLSTVSSLISGKQDQSKLEQFSASNESIFKMLEELSPDKTGFWWELYGAFFGDLSKNGLTRCFSFYISLSQGDAALVWIQANQEEFGRFEAYLND